LAFIAVEIFMVTEAGEGYNWIYTSYGGINVGYLEHGSSQ
jgi:hypothetical protein